MSDNTFPPLLRIDVDDTTSASCRTCGAEFAGDERGWELHAIRHQHLIEIVVTSTKYLAPQSRIRV